MMYNANGDKLVRKFLPVQFYDIHGIELWFEEMSAHGLILDSFGVRSAIFRVGAPEPHVRYRLEPMTHWDRSLDYNKNNAYAQAGWEYVDFISKYFYIYRCRDQSIPDLHTDPVTQSLVFHRMFRRRLPVFLLFIPLRILDYLTLPFTAAANRQQLISDFLQRLVVLPYPTLLSLPLPLWAAVVFFAYLWRTWKIWQLRCQLNRGIPLDTGKRYPRSVIRSAATCAVPIVCLTLLLPCLFFRSVPPFTYYQMLKPETELPAPLFSLYDVELAEGYELPLNSDYKRSPSPFSANYSIAQGYGWKGGWRGNLDVQEARLELDLYDTRSPAFAQAMLDHHQQSVQAYRSSDSIEAFSYRPLACPGVDELYANASFDEDPGEKRLYAYGRAGSRYFYLAIDGVKDPWVHIRRFLEDLVQSDPREGKEDLS